MKYRNPWHRENSDSYGPKMYETNVKPTVYGPYQIFQRVKGCFDLVINGCCIRQVCTLKGAKMAADDHKAGNLWRGMYEWTKLSEQQ